jgi:hypothetical protein
MSSRGSRRLAGEDSEQESGKQSANGHYARGRQSLPSGSLEISAHPASPLAGGGWIGTEFRVSRHDGLTSSERVAHCALNMANPNAKAVSRRRKSAEVQFALAALLARADPRSAQWMKAF